MTYNPEIHHRRSIRLKGYDYSQAGAYFVTICTQYRECLFGEITNGQMILNDAGRIVADEWMKSGTIRDEIELDEWVVMPNHFHGIIIICDNGRGDRPIGVEGTGGLCRGDRPVAPTPGIPTKPGPRPKSIGAMMAGFKSAATKRIDETQNTPGAKLWQRNYYEHIIRDENELNRIREYIANNPVKWENDQENPQAVLNDQ